MHKFILVAAAAALAGCSQADTTSAAENTSEAAQQPAAADAAVASWPVEPGTYEYTRSDGRAGVNTLAADGTYSNAITGGATETGTWAIENGQSCLVSDGGEKRCYTFTQPDAEGNLTGTMADGVTITVRKTA